MRLTLIGTGHVFRIGEIVAQIIEKRGPHVVCVELDPVRLAGLQDRARLAAYEEPLTQPPGFVSKYAAIGAAAK